MPVTEHFPILKSAIAMLSITYKLAVQPKIIQLFKVPVMIETQDFLIKTQMYISQLKFINSRFSNHCLQCLSANQIYYTSLEVGLQNETSLHYIFYSNIR